MLEFDQDIRVNTPAPVEVPWEFLSSRQPESPVFITFQVLHDSYPNILCLNETEKHI